MNEYLHEHFLKKHNEICELSEQLEIDELYFFGSSVNGKFIKGKSDLDVYVKTDSSKIKNVVRLQLRLGEMFDCSVDIFHSSWKVHLELEEYIEENKKIIFKRINSLSN